MKIDVYTKVILTGILICMGLFLLRDVPFVDKAHAELDGGIPSEITVNLVLSEMFVGRPVDLDD